MPPVTMRNAAVDIPGVSGHVGPMRALLAGTSGVDKGVVISNLIARLAAHGDIPQRHRRRKSLTPIRAMCWWPTSKTSWPSRATIWPAPCHPSAPATNWRRGSRLACASPNSWSQPTLTTASLPPTSPTTPAAGSFRSSTFPPSAAGDPTASSRWWTTCWTSTPPCSAATPDQHTNFRLRLREILAWRSAEIAMADLLARNLYEMRTIPHYVVGIKHPAEMLYRLIFRRRQYPLVYSSFPITAVRDDPDLRSRIDDIRNELHRRFIVFDPLTLDEGTTQVFARAQAAVSDAVPEITVCEHEARWPMEIAGTLSDGRPPAYPMTLDPQEALEVWDDLENQIRHRDLTMVEQAQCIAAYRITMGGRLSTGMYSELMYATHTAEPARPVLMYADPSDNGLDHPFLRNFNHRTFHSLDDWYDAVSRIGPAPDPEAQQPLF